MKKLLYVICFAILVFSCNSSDDSDDSNNPNNNLSASMSAEIDGENFFSTTSFDTLAGSVLSTGGSYGFVINGVEVIDNANGRGIGLAFGGVDFDEFSAGDEFFGNTFENSFCTFSITTDGVSTAGTSEGVSSYVRITSIDRDNQIISGVFNYEAIDFEDPNITYVISNGIFTNVPYVFVQ